MGYLGARVEAGRERGLRGAYLAVGSEVACDLAVELAERGEGGDEVDVEEAERELAHAARLLEVSLVRVRVRARARARARVRVRARARVRSGLGFLT